MRTITASSSTWAATLARWDVLVVVAAVAAAAVWLGTSSRDDRDARAADGAGRGSAASTSAGGADVDPARGASDKVAPTSAAEAPPRGVVIASGSTQTDGFPTGFPYTDLGAVAVQFELAKAQIGFDYDQATSVATLYAEPADAEVFARRAREAVALRRRQAGVPPEGAVPAPASYAVTPIAYTLAELDTDYYAVNLLSYVTLTTVDGASRDNLYAGTQLVRWVPDSGSGDGGDWKVAAGTISDLEELAAEGQPRAVSPGTSAYAEDGWITLDLSGGATTGGR